MKIVSLDLHEDASQMVVADENGRVLDQMRVPTEKQQRRRLPALRSDLGRLCQ